MQKFGSALLALVASALMQGQPKKVVAFPDCLGDTNATLGSKSCARTEKAFWAWVEDIQLPNSALEAGEVQVLIRTFVKGLNAKPCLQEFYSIQALKALISAGYEVPLPLNRLVDLAASESLPVSEQALFLLLSLEPIQRRRAGS